MPATSTYKRPAPSSYQYSHPVYDKKKDEDTSSWVTPAIIGYTLGAASNHVDRDDSPSFSGGGGSFSGGGASGSWDSSSSSSSSSDSSSSSSDSSSSSSE